MPVKPTREQWQKWGRNPPKWLPEGTRQRLRESLRPMGRYRIEYYLDRMPAQLYEVRIDARDIGQAKDKFWAWAHREHEHHEIAISYCGRIENSDYFEIEFKEAPNGEAE